MIYLSITLPAAKRSDSNDITCNVPVYSVCPKDQWKINSLIPEFIPATGDNQNAVLGSDWLSSFCNLKDLFLICAFFIISSRPERMSSQIHGSQHIDLLLQNWRHSLFVIWLTVVKHPHWLQKVFQGLLEVRKLQCHPSHNISFLQGVDRSSNTPSNNGN